MSHTHILFSRHSRASCRRDTRRFWYPCSITNRHRCFWYPCSIANRHRCFLAFGGEARLFIIHKEKQFKLRRHCRRRCGRCGTHCNRRYRDRLVIATATSTGVGPRGYLHGSASYRCISATHGRDSAAFDDGRCVYGVVYTWDYWDIVYAWDTRHTPSFCQCRNSDEALCTCFCAQLAVALLCSSHALPCPFFFI
jgi:hypothetical protein